MSTTPEAPTFADWTNRLKVRNEFFLALGEYKLRIANAEKAKAEAANEMVTVKSREMLIAELQRELLALRQQKKQTDKEIANAERQAREVRRLMRGAEITRAAFSDARTNCQNLLESTLTQLGDTLYSIKVTDSERAAANFLCVDKTKPVTAAPGTIENAVALLYWMLNNEYMAHGGSAAQQAVRRIFNAIDDEANENTSALRKAMDEMKKGTYQAWNVSGLLAGAPKGSPAANIAAAAPKPG